MRVRKVAVTLFLMLACCLQAWSASFHERVMDQSYDTGPLLEAFYDESMAEESGDYWDGFTISLITASKDNPLYSWFGHSAIMIERIGDEDYSPMMVDYGSFKFGPGFYVNFAMGRLWYTCEASSATYRVNYMSFKGRTVSKVVLNLSAQQKKAILCYLQENIQPENKTYLYHNYIDNCATRIRDLLNRATDGGLFEWSSSIEGYSFREEASMVLGNSPAVLYLLNFMQGKGIDGDGTLWDAMFLPKNLEKAVLSYPGLAVSQEYLSDYRATDTRPVDKASPVSGSAFAAIVASGLVLVSLLGLSVFRKRFYGIATCVVNLALGLAGTLLLFMMCFTLHDYMWWNENIILANPLLIVMAVMSLKTMQTKKGDPAKAMARLRTLYRMLFFAGCALIALKLVLPGVLFQDNWCQLLSILPYYAVNGFFPMKD